MFFSRPNDSDLVPAMEGSQFIPLGPSQKDMRKAIRLLSGIAGSAPHPTIENAAIDACITAIVALQMSMQYTMAKVGE